MPKFMLFTGEDVKMISLLLNMSTDSLHYVVMLHMVTTGNYDCHYYHCQNCCYMVYSVTGKFNHLVGVEAKIFP